MVERTREISTNSLTDHVLEVLSPVAKIAEGKLAPASRTTDLTGKTIGLYWNQKPDGDINLSAVARLLESRFQNLRFKWFVYPFPTASDDLAEVVNAGVDAVVGTSAY